MPATVKPLTKKDIQEVLAPVVKELKELKREATLWKIESKGTKQAVEFMEMRIRRLTDDFLIFKDSVGEEFQTLTRKFLDSLDPIMGELKGIREDSAAQSMINEDLEKLIHGHEKRITKLETTS